MAGGNEDNCERSSSLPTEVFACLERHRQLVQDYIHSHQYPSALFWADKAVSLSNGDVQDVFSLAECFLLTKQYHRAAHSITSKNLDKTYPACKYLAAKCHYEAKEYQEALCVIDGLSKSNGDTKSNISDIYSLARFSLKKIESSLLLLKGKIYEAMDNRTLAADCFKEALLEDVYCYEAFECLVQHQMLSLEEERELMSRMPFTFQCGNSDDTDIVAFLYENKLKKYSKPCLPKATLPAVLSVGLQNNFDVLIGEAERHYYGCNYRECFRLTTKVLDKDPYHKDCLPIHIACLVELQKADSIFHLAHRLVDLYPDSALSWFAVGCYYLLSGKNDHARRYLSKSTTLDRVFGPAWLAYGHSFAVENEHDQAMAAYFKASKLMKGCHLPLLYIGLEYGLTNNPRLAEKFFSQALAIAPDDPFVLHEMGVIAFQNQYWETAEQYFRNALEWVKSTDHAVVPEKWEPLYNNLGHTCRKLKKYQEALDFHEKALVLAPQTASTYTAIGYVYSLLGNSSYAVDYFHKALGLRRDDTFSTAMLGNVIEQLMNEVPSCEGEPDEIPPFTITSPSSVNSTADSSGGGFLLSTSTNLTAIGDVEMDITD